MTGSPFVIDLFSGAGGWAEGLRSLGIDSVGVELDEAAATANAAGNTTVRADVAEMDPNEYGGADGLIASPPCQTFSNAGSKLGWIDTAGLRSEILSSRRRWRSSGATTVDPRSALVLEPLRWLHVIRPTWFALEQVPMVLPLWKAYTVAVADMGYESTTAILDAADYGVPQHRRRAILIGSRDGHVSMPPASRGGRISASRALGVPEAWEINTGRRWVSGGGRGAAQRVSLSKPAPTVTGQSISWQMWGPDGERRSMSLREGAVLQGFRADYPWTGSKSERWLQIGNAVPPPLAAAIVEAAMSPEPIVRQPVKRWAPVSGEQDRLI